MAWQETSPCEAEPYDVAPAPTPTPTLAPGAGTSGGTRQGTDASGAARADRPDAKISGPQPPSPGRRVRPAQARLGTAMRWRSLATTSSPVKPAARACRSNSVGSP